MILPLRAAGILTVLILGSAPGSAARAAGFDGEEDLQRLVEADWDRQEQLRGRGVDSPEAIREAIRRAERLRADLASLPGLDLSREGEALERLQARVDRLDLLDGPSRASLYREIRWATRALASRNPLLENRPIVFMQRRRFVCQMLHEYLGYFYDKISGGGIYVLEQPWKSLRTRDVLGGRLGEGNFTTLSLSYDGQTLYFAFADSSRPKPDYYRPSAGTRVFQIWSVRADGTDLRRLTEDRFDNFDPCPLPDGGVAYISSRRGGFGRCHNPWEPLPAYTLHRMDADGRNPRTLSFHETNEWHPGVLADGRIVYSRWDYVDRSAANFHGLWTSNPDGTNPAILFGNYTADINACYQPRAIPGSNRILFVAGAHHADVGGSLVIVDPTAARLKGDGEDDLDSIERLTPYAAFPETGKDWGRCFFHSPWPLSETYFLASFGYGAVPGMSSGNPKDTPTGLYYLDRFGNLELLYRAEGISSMYPIPLAPRPQPPAIPSMLHPELGDEGELMLADAHRSHLPLPAGRRVAEVRVFQVFPKTQHVVNKPRIGHANAEPARMLLGTVPVESDGSAFFRVPARKPLYFQTVDEEGKAVQTMRSVTYLQPGERRGCVGCHEGPQATHFPRQSRAFERGPSSLRPGPDGSRPMSYVRLVQPILDRHCVRCHAGGSGPGRGSAILTGEPVEKSPFSRSYVSLKPFVRWHEWGGASIDQAVSRPGRVGATLSPLTRILDDAVHAPEVKLSDSERRALYLWLDANVPFYGTYEKDSQEAQRKGLEVGVPEVQ